MSRTTSAVRISYVGVACTECEASNFLREDQVAHHGKASFANCGLCDQHHTDKLAGNRSRHRRGLVGGAELYHDPGSCRRLPAVLQRRVPGRSQAHHRNLFSSGHMVTYKAIHMIARDACCWFMRAKSTFLGRMYRIPSNL